MFPIHDLLLLTKKAIDTNTNAEAKIVVAPKRTFSNCVRVFHQLSFLHGEEGDVNGWCDVSHKNNKMRLTLLRSSMTDMSSIAASFRWSIKERVGKRVQESKLEQIGYHTEMSMVTKDEMAYCFFGPFLWSGKSEKAWWWRWWEKKKRREYTVAEKEIQLDRRKFWWWTKISDVCDFYFNKKERQGLLTKERVAWRSF